ncbi:hypothetical protein NLU13_5692 [Sarocladium strictum]|uniref:Uncharacterized protein n=1 Tax=Sarocladium strictum TaxID=5046 RepID=A0AA39L817_SARSR|nr:hypothetical protein NLU13_5692 [Sarocladium strictum]
MSYHKFKSEDTSDHDQDDSSGGNEDDLSNHTSPISRWYLRMLYILLAENFLLVIAFVLFWKALVPKPTNLQYQILTPDNKAFPLGHLAWAQSFEALPCGKTPDEAKARGCQFDMLATAWLPPRCIDYELVDEFMKLGDWQFYTEMHGGQKHSSYEPEYLGSFSEPKSIWTSRAWHHMHCLYMWKKIGRALVRGTPSDAETISEPHTHHCMKAMEEVIFGPHRDPNEIEVFIEVIYPPC